MLTAGTMVVIFVVAALSGYVLGRKHERRIRVNDRTIYVRPHTEKTLKKYPLPEEREDPSTVVEAQWSRTNLPNSGVRWS